MLLKFVLMFVLPYLALVFIVLSGVQMLVSKKAYRQRLWLITAVSVIFSVGYSGLNYLEERASLLRGNEIFDGSSVGIFLFVGAFFAFFVAVPSYIVTTVLAGNAKKKQLS